MAFGHLLCALASWTLPLTGDFPASRKLRPISEIVKGILVVPAALRRPAALDARPNRGWHGLWSDVWRLVLLACLALSVLCVWTPDRAQAQQTTCIASGPNSFSQGLNYGYLDDGSCTQVSDINSGRPRIFFHVYPGLSDLNLYIGYWDSSNNPTYFDASSISVSNYSGVITYFSSTNTVAVRNNVPTDFADTANSSTITATITVPAGVNPLETTDVTYTFVMTGARREDGVSTITFDQLTVSGGIFDTPAPTITDIDPAVGPTAGGTEVTITGTNFVDGSTAVTFGGVDAASITFVSTTELTVETPAGTAGAVDVVVTTGGGSATSTGGFRYRNAPTITGIDPDEGPTAGGTTVTITGTNFVDGSTTVSFGTNAGTNITVNSRRELTVETPSGTAGPVDVVVTSAGGSVTSTGGFTYDDAAPTVTSVSPSVGPTTGGTTVTIIGTKLTAATAVSFGGTSATSFAVDNDGQITAVTPAGTAGTASVLVTTPGGTNAANTLFTYGTGPTVTSVSPDEGPTAGSTTVTITGANLTAAMAVTFDGNSATSFNVVSATQMTATTPAGTAGTASVLVTTPFGTNAANTLFTYRNAPTITGIDPAAGPTAGGTEVTITGTNFVDGSTTVSFAGNAGANITVKSPTELTVETPAGTAGAVNVVVTTAGGGATSSGGFTYQDAPTVSSVSPAVGPVGGGTTVTITGTNLTGATAVTFGGTSATSFNVDSDTKITAVTPAGTAGAASVLVTTSGGANAANTLFTYDGTPPTVTISADKTAISPTETAEIEFEVSETGTDFDPALHVTVTGGTLSNLGGADPVYTATFTPTFGSANPGAKATIVVAASTFTDGAGNDNEESNTLEIDFSSAIAGRTSRIIRNIISRRADQITANEPDLSSRLNRGGGGGGTAGLLSGQGDLVSNNQLTFSTSLSQMAAWRRAQNAGPVQHVGGLPVHGYHSGDFGFGAGDGPLPNFDLWLKGKLVQIDNGTSSSLLGLIHAGADYAVNPDLVVGLMAQLDIMDEKDDTEGFSAGGTGWMAGPYVVARLTDRLVLDARAAWGTSDNKVSPYNTYEDSFDTERWLVAAKFTGDIDLGGVTVAPHVGMIYFEEAQKAYTDSNAVTIPGQTVSLGRLTFGPKLSWNHVTEDGESFTFHWSASGIWDFETADLVSLETGLAATGTTDLRARTEAGIAMHTANGVTLGLEGFYDGIGADNFDVYGGAVRVSVPLQ